MSQGDTSVAKRGRSSHSPRTANGAGVRGRRGVFVARNQSAVARPRVSRSHYEVVRPGPVRDVGVGFAVPNHQVALGVGRVGPSEPVPNVHVAPLQNERVEGAAGTEASQTSRQGVEGGPEHIEFLHRHRLQRPSNHFVGAMRTDDSLLASFLWMIGWIR